MMRTRYLLTMACTLGLWAGVSHAEGSLLWKTGNHNPAMVVPPYANQVSPFPKVIKEKAAVAEQPDQQAVSEALAEQKRLRDEAFSRTEDLIRSGRGFEPMLGGLQVGGTLDGLLGKRVLLNNQWVGVGSGLDVRRVRTREMTETITLLKEYDADAAGQMESEMNTALAGNATVRLTVKKIEPALLTLASPSGQTYTLPISVNK